MTFTVRLSSSYTRSLPPWTSKNSFSTYSKVTLNLITFFLNDPFFKCYSCVCGQPVWFGIIDPYLSTIFEIGFFLNWVRVTEKLPIDIIWGEIDVYRLLEFYEIRFEIRNGPSHQRTMAHRPLVESENQLVLSVSSIV